MEAYEQKPNNDGFLQLLGLFRKENFAQILGFKFQNHAKGVLPGGGGVRTGTTETGKGGGGGGKEEDGETTRGGRGGGAAEGSSGRGGGSAAAAAASSSAATPTTPASLYILAATLVRAGVVELDALYAHLAPADDAAVEAHKAAVSLRLAAVRKIGVVNLLAKASEVRGTNQTKGSPVRSIPSNIPQSHSESIHSISFSHTPPV